MFKEKLFLGLTAVLLICSILISQLIFINRVSTLVNISFFDNNPFFLNDSIVNKLLIQKRDNKENHSNLKLDLNDIEKYLDSYPGVRKAEVFLSVSGITNVKIHESSALLRIQNESFYIDTFGGKIPFSKMYSPKVPVYSGVFKNENLKNLINITNSINIDTYLKSEFVEIWNSNLGFSIRLRNYDFEIFFGDIKNINKKIIKLKAFCAYNNMNNFDKKPKKIDLTVFDQVISIH